MKHKHKWQFKKEFSLLANCVLTNNFPICHYDDYNTFVCECGAEKDVKVKG